MPTQNGEFMVSTEVILLVISLLFFLSIFACKAGYKFGVPVLLLFLGVGMLCGSDGLGFEFQNMQVAQAISTVALCIILFSGGMDTKIEDIKPVMAQGLVLSTVGVLLTAVLTGVLIPLVFQGSGFISVQFPLLSALLLASMMSSTDSASVFSILRSKGLALKHNLRPMLELESGSNDPVAYMLTLTFISMINVGGEPDILSAVGMLIMQLVIGALVGFILGKLFVWMINAVNIDNASLYPIMVLTVCIFMFSAAHFMGGNSYLAVYIGGLVLGNSRMVHKRSSINFFDGIAWLSQLVMFLTLGLLVNPHELIDVAIPGLIISVIMILITRPLSVFICLLPFRKMETKDKVFISWCGLRGAVPIVFAIFALSEHVPGAQIMFNIVFCCTLVSLIVQGTSLSFMAAKLDLIDQSEGLRSVKDFDLEFSEEMKSTMTELTINDQVLKTGNKLLNLGLPENTLAVMVKRGETFFIPKGNTELQLDDKLLLITNNSQELMETFVNMGIDPAQGPIEARPGMLEEFMNLTGDIKGKLKWPRKNNSAT